jgi:hypothetical protein
VRNGMKGKEIKAFLLGRNGTPTASVRSEGIPSHTSLWAKQSQARLDGECGASSQPMIAWNC